MKTSTIAVQIGVGKDATGAMSFPIYQNATFRHPALGQSTGYDYSRSGNPTRKVLEEGIACLDGGVRGFAYASGMAAITNLLLLFKQGDHLVVTEDLYGGTFRIIDKVFARQGLEATYVDTSDANRVAEAIRENTRAVLLEVPTNPLLKVADIRKIGDIAKDRRILTIVDNTFMTPYLLRPLELGADVVVYSATKFISGHNDVLAGLVVVREAELNADHLPGLSDPLGHGPERAGTDGDQRQAAQAVGGD